MFKRSFLVISIFGLVLAAFIPQTSPVEAQKDETDDVLHMSGSIGKGNIMTGFYGKNAQAIQNKDWCVFVGDTGKVYKISLIERNIKTLYIDGQKIADDQIWKHTAEYKPYLLRFWRESEIEKESAEIESRIKPLDRKIETLEKEIEKLDKREEDLEKNSSSSFTDTQKSINAERKKLEQMQNKYDQQIEELSDQQESLSDEQESLNLDTEMDKVFEQMIADLKSLGVIKSSNNLSFKLSSSKLIVNGKQAPPDVYDLLKAKYIVELSGDFGFLYRWKERP